MPRRTAWPLLVAATLLLLLAALATLQYRWIGQVSDAERDRLRAGLKARASAFAGDFDRALTQIYVAFQANPARFDDADTPAFLNRALSASAVSGAAIVKDVYLFDPASPHALARFDAVRRTLDPTVWPASLERLRQRVDDGGAVGKAGLLFANLIDAATPALVIPVPLMQQIPTGAQIAILRDPLSSARAVIVVLDADQLQRRLIEPLAAKHFGDAGSSEYYVTIVRRDDPSHVVYSSSPEAPVDAKTADVTAGLFDLRVNEVQALPGAPEQARPSVDRDGWPNAKFAITIVRRALTGDGGHVLLAGSGEGEWLLMVRGQGGSLETLVAASRRRNLAISLGIVGLLAASVALVLGSAQRQRRLARQQIEFVAAVSHELRTPLAVICSAGENLADGVVGDSRQVRRYGSLVETEGRRLADMVERVMEFAGITAGTKRATHMNVDLAQIVDAAAAGVCAEARERRVAIDVRHAAHPTVVADAGALRCAVQNLIGNAVKYSQPGTSVAVVVQADAAAVIIRIADRGLGIDARDLPHIFKPFFRGRRALDAQIRGSGVGLSVVRHVIDAHRGSIHVESRAGEGTTVTVRLAALDVGSSARERQSVAS